jgi:hypothetical protein
VTSVIGDHASARRDGDRTVRAVGLVVSLAYAGAILWAYAAQPQRVSDVSGAVASRLGAYEVDGAAFEAGRRYFFEDRFREARIAFERADPAARDARTQFYVAYSFYREGWGRFYHDDALYEQGLAAVRRAAALSGGVVHADDDRLLLRTSDELRAELERGITREASDLDPRRALDTRK